MTTAATQGPCPVCNGTARKPVPEDSQRYIKYNARWGHWGVSGYAPAGPGPFADGQGYEGGTLPCGNCGGSTMSGKATGRVYLREDGTPCSHQWDVVQAGRCYHKYSCRHCPDKFSIDSGD